MKKLIDPDRLKDILEYGILCNIPADAVNTKEEKLNDWVQEVVDKATTVEAYTKEEMIEMYDKIVKTSYHTAESHPKYKGIMLYEAQKIIDIMKEYLFKKNEDENDK